MITRRRLSIGLAGGAVAAMVPLAVVYACSALVAVTPTSISGAPGSTIGIKVTQVYGNAQVNVYMAGRTSESLVYSGTAPSNPPGSPTTSMSFSLTVPNWAPGEYYFKVTAIGGSPVATYYGKNAAVFQILAPPPTSQYNSTNGPTGLRPGTSMPGATGQANATPNGSTLAGSPVAAPQLSSAIAVRAGDRDGIAQAFPASPASRASQSGSTVALAPEAAGQGNAMQTALFVGVVTLAVGLPLLVMGFATVTALQRRTTRTASRNDDSHRDQERIS